MAMDKTYAAVEPVRSEIDGLEGPIVVEFGAPWCGYCIAAQSLLEAALAAYPRVRHLKVEDGKGRPLGRSFRVTLWPTLVFLNSGRVVSRLVRPVAEEEIRQALAGIDKSD